jgi:hypothetical protein
MLSFCGGNYSVSELQLITYTFHPLPDQKELSCRQRWLGRPMILLMPYSKGEPSYWSSISFSRADHTSSD